MFKIICSFLFASFIFLFCAKTFAGQQTGSIKAIYMRSGEIGTADDSLVYVTMQETASAYTGRPACSTRDYWMLADAKSPIGQAQIAMILTAKALGRPVYIKGSNSCSRWPDGETVYEIQWAE